MDNVTRGQEITDRNTTTGTTAGWIAESNTHLHCWHDGVCCWCGGKQHGSFAPPVPDMHDITISVSDPSGVVWFQHMIAENETLVKQTLTKALRGTR